MLQADQNHKHNHQVKNTRSQTLLNYDKITKNDKVSTFWLTAYFNNKTCGSEGWQNKWKHFMIHSSAIFMIMVGLWKFCLFPIMGSSEGNSANAVRQHPDSEQMEKDKPTQKQTCNKSSNSQVQVQVPYPQVQVQVHLKRASPSPSPLQKRQVQVQVQRTCKQFYPIPILFLLLLLSKTLYRSQKKN